MDGVAAERRTRIVPELLRKTWYFIALAPLIVYCVATSIHNDLVLGVVLYPGLIIIGLVWLYVPLWLLLFLFAAIKYRTKLGWRLWAQGACVFALVSFVCFWIATHPGFFDL
jgi:hypothetical protein